MEENDTSTAAAASSSAAGQTDIRDATPDDTEISAGVARLTKDMIMILEMRRGPDEEPESFYALGLEGVTATCGLFMSIQHQAEELLDRDETITRIDVKLISDSPDKELMTDFIMTPKASLKNRTWELLLEELQDHCDRTGNADSVKMKMRATLLVKKAIVGSWNNECCETSSSCSRITI
jgi:hypothetical protein